MTYLSGKTQKRKKYTRYALYTSVFLIVVIFWPFIKKHTFTVVEPAVIQVGVAKQSFVFFPEFFRTYLTSHRTLVTQEKVLKQRIEILENSLAETEANLREQTFRNSLTLQASTSPTSPLIMYPLMQDISKLYGTVLLSKGYKDGVDIGDIAYIRGNQAACVIKEVYPASSLCLLLTASGVTTEGVTSSSSITLALIGRGGYYLANITRDTPVTVGEVVYMRSNPRVVLGTIKQVANNNQDTSWHVFVEGAYNPVTSSIFYVHP